MVKHPYIALYVGDWLKDPKLSLCSPATRGVWIDLICCLHELGQGGKITANAQQLARLCRSSDADIHAALKELQATDAADIYERDSIYTVVCRRMAKIADLSLKRQQAGSKAHSKKEANPDIDIESEDDGLRKVREFCTAERIPQSDADWFYWKGRANGWTNGGKPILDWKATLRSWQRGKYLPSQKKPAQTQAYFPKKPAPKGEAYQQRPPGREVSDEEMSKMQPIVRDAVEKLKAQFKMP